MRLGTEQVYRAKLENSIPGNEEQSKIKDARAIKLARSALKEDSPGGVGYGATELEDGQQDLSRLVTIRQVHQTRRAATSTKACRASAPPAPGSTASQRQQICSQMADVIRRSGTGTERNTRWRSGNAPGTKDSAEVLQLSGNSANAELAAKERMKLVRNLTSPQPHA